MDMCYGQINKINANTYNKQHHLRYCNSLDKSKMRFSEAMCRTDSRHMHGITPVLQHSESTPRRAFSTHIGRGAQKILRHFESSGKRKQANLCTSCCAEICARNHIETWTFRQAMVFLEIQAYTFFKQQQTCENSKTSSTCFVCSKANNCNLDQQDHFQKTKPPHVLTSSNM